MSTATTERRVKKGRGRSQNTLDMVRAMHDILEEIEPASVRAVCYRLFVAKLIPDMSRGSTSKVSRMLVTARENGEIPWDWVVDENRQAEHVATWTDPEEIIRVAARQYRKDFWRDQPHWVEVWSEKGTVRGTLAPVLDKYGITLRVMHGYSSATVLHDVAKETRDSARPLTILYVGDHDPSGMAMSGIDIPERLARYNGSATIRRVSVSWSDIYEHDLPSFSAASKAQDPRHKWFVDNFGYKCYELDALPPPILRQNVEDDILEFIDMPTWEHSAAIEAAEVESMAGFLATWNGISTPVQKYPGGAP